MSKFFEKFKNAEIINPTVVLAIICVVVTLALSLTNLLTAKKIDALKIETKNKAMAKLIDAQFSEPIEIDETTQYNEAIKDGETIGLIFTTETNGYGGVISVMTAVDMDGKIIAVEILAADDETPGLGQNVTKEDFYTQFAGLKDEITVIKGGSANAQNNEINAVTGATISSRAVTSAVNQALDYAAEIIVEGDELK